MRSRDAPAGIRRRRRSDVPQPHAPLRDALRGGARDARRRLAPTGLRDRGGVRWTRGPSSSSARPARRSRTTRSSSTPTSCSSRWRRRRASSTSRPATPSTRSTSAVTRWPSVRSTGRRSCGRATCAGTPRWTTSATSAASPRPSAVLDSAGGVVASPTTPRWTRRHLDMTYALQTLTDKIYMGNVVSGVERPRHPGDDRDPVRRPRGDRARPRRTISLINCNSPLRWDDRMLEAQFEYTRRQPGRGAHAVPADGRDVAGVDPRGAGAADGRGADGDRARPS